MADEYMDKDFKLVTPDHLVEAFLGGGVTLPCHLSPQTSAVAMEIRWFKGTDCIYLYNNGHVKEGRGYEGRVSVNTQELQRGDVSLTLRERREEVGRVYTCQVISGKHKEEGRVRVTQDLFGRLFAVMAYLFGWRDLFAPKALMAGQSEMTVMQMMEESVQSLDFKLVTPDPVVKASVGDDVTLPCHLPPETSAVAMEIRWFKGTDCIYLYKNGHVIVREDYEGRVSVNTQELQRGDVSLRLREIRWGDEGVYTCQVISGEHKEEGRVRVTQRGLIDRFGVLYVEREVTPEERERMEESVQSLDPDPPPVRRRDSMEGNRPSM